MHVSVFIQRSWWIQNWTIGLMSKCRVAHINAKKINSLENDIVFFKELYNERSFRYVWVAPLHGEIDQAMHKQLAGFLLLCLPLLWDNDYYYFIDYHSVKIVPCCCLVKTTHIIHQLLLTKFGNNIIILNQWCQNDVTSAAHSRLGNPWPENLETRWYYFWWAEKQRWKWQNSLRTGKYFEWIIKHYWIRLL